MNKQMFIYPAILYRDMEININALIQNLEYQKQFVEIARDNWKDIVTYEEYLMLNECLGKLIAFNQKIGQAKGAVKGKITLK